MENGKISDENIVASSWQEPFHSFRPEAGRLNNDDGVWCPNTLGEANKEHFLQVEFPARYNMCAVATQGSPLYNTDWVMKYRIQYSMDGQNFTLYTENGTVKVRHHGCTPHEQLEANDMTVGRGGGGWKLKINIYPAVSRAKENIDGQLLTYIYQAAFRLKKYRLCWSLKLNSCQ